MANEVHIVMPGQCISSIAFEHGFFPDTLWNDPANAELKEKRQNPGVLLEGDEVAIPELRLKIQAAASERRHCFRRKGVPEKLRLQLMRNDCARADVGYVLTIERTAHERADRQGRLARAFAAPQRAARARSGWMGTQRKFRLCWAVFLRWTWTRAWRRA